VLLTLLGLPGVAYAQTASPSTPPGDTVRVPALPVSARPLSKQSMVQCVDSSLQVRLRRQVSRAGWGALAEQDELAVGVVDLSDPDRPRYAALNGQEMMYAASLPKIGILYAAVRQMERGRLSSSPDVQDDLQSMIRVSSNAAATRMIDRVGGLQSVNRALRSTDAAFYDREHGGGLWVGKRFSADDRRQPDPIEGLSHAATVHQVARFYTLLATGRLINRARSVQMLDALSDPALDHKFVGVLQRRAPAADIYRKSGTWRTWHADSALVWGPHRRYVLVALVKAPHGDQVVRGLLPAAEAALGLSGPSSADRTTRK
jgi:beta-lactamase class A